MTWSCFCGRGHLICQSPVFMTRACRTSFLEKVNIGGEIHFSWNVCKAVSSSLLNCSSSFSCGLRSLGINGDVIRVRCRRDDRNTLYKPINEHSWVFLIGTFMSRIAYLVLLKMNSSMLRHNLGNSSIETRSRHFFWFQRWITHLWFLFLYHWRKILMSFWIFITRQLQGVLMMQQSWSKFFL